MAFGNGYTFGFAAVVCIVCSTALAGVSMGLKDKQEANARRDLYKNILESLDLPEADASGVRPAISGKEIDELWADKVELVAIDPSNGQKIDGAQADVDGNGTFDQKDLRAAKDAVKGTEKPPAVLGLFVRKDNGTVAIPMDGKGLWGPISAYLAFDPKLETVKGATFFAPKETPGLGAEITNPPFEGAFIDKTITEGGKTVPIRVPKPSECDEANDPHCVDGVSGATLTSRGVNAMIEQSLAIYEPYIQTVR